MAVFVKLVNGVGYVFSTLKNLLTALIIMGCLLIISLFTPIFSAVILSLLNWYPLPNNANVTQSPSAIVLLVGGLTNNQQNDIIINQFTESRLIEAKKAYDTTLLPIIVSGKDAPWMIDWLQRHAVMWVVPEKNSFNTCQNAKFTAETISVKNVVLVTDAYHMNRSRRQFALNNIATVPRIAPLNKPTDWYHLDQNLQHSRRAMYELLAFSRDLIRPQYECQPSKY